MRVAPPPLEYEERVPSAVRLPQDFPPQFGDLYGSAVDPERPGERRITSQVRLPGHDIQVLLGFWGLKLGQRRAPEPRICLIHRKDPQVIASSL